MKKLKNKKIRYAVVGLGHISQVAVLPAFRRARRNSELVALVSDTPKKLKKLSKRHRVPLTVSYAAYEELLASGAVDAVYIALPNTMHKKYALKAFKHGVHVLCEKPMATTQRDCQVMRDAARKSGFTA